MAELALKVGDNSTYKDGDILCAFNRRRIGCAHMQHICHHRKYPLVNGLRAVGTLAQYMKEAISQYRFERISASTVKRVEISGGKEEEFSATPNGEGHYIHVAEFVERRLASPNHALFGSPGREIWYGGRTDMSAAKVDGVWAEIESTTAKRRVDYPLWPAGGDDLKMHLFLTVDEFDDAEAERLVGPLGIGGSAKKRKYHIDWEAELSLTAKEKDDIRNVGTSVDVRDKPAVNHAGILQTKTL